MSQQQPASWLDPKLDVVFKALFGRQSNADLLVSLFNGLLELPEHDQISSVQLLSPLMEVEATEEKLSVLDLAVRDARGRQYVVEMQCRNHIAFPERMLYYAARRYGEQLRSGEDYATLRPLVLVVLTDFALMPELPDWRESFELRAQSSSALFSAHLRVVLIELPKFTKPAEQASSLGEKWLAFLKEGMKMSTETRDAPWVTPELRKAMEELEKLAGDEQMRQLYEARLRQVQIKATEIRESFEQGQEQAAYTFARRLLQEGEAPERVARLTGLTLEAIQAL